MSEKERVRRLLCTDKTPDEKAICKAAFRNILDGKAISHGELVRATGLMPERVDAILAQLADRGLLVIEPEGGPVIGSWGLSLRPTEHKLLIRGRELYTWCAVDAVGIPAGLGETATVASKCSQCGETVNIEMTDGRVSRVDPTDVQVWVAPSQVGRSVVGFT